MTIFFKKRFGGEIEMTESEALDMAKFIYSNIRTVKTAEKVNYRFVGISFTESQLGKTS